jgi:ABC-type multidrug transport system fused ATPase/permease subunit
LTGSGKSTLATLLVRLRDPDDGTISLDGHPLPELSHAALAAAVALVPQQTFLFDDTVRDNVTLGAEIGDDDVWAALRTAQADGFVQALPAGLDTHVGERGTTLSGGQRQRLALARALVRHPRLLVLDDATSAVDPEVESRILAALRRPTGQPAEPDGLPVAPTVVVIAYRKVTISLADEVVLLAGGRVAERGTHADLLQRSAVYRDLVDAYDRSRRATQPTGDATSPAPGEPPRGPPPYAPSATPSPFPSTPKPTCRHRLPRPVGWAVALARTPAPGCCCDEASPPHPRWAPG